MVKIGKKVGFLGSGKMAEALIRGMLRKGIIDKNDVICFDIKQERLDYIHQECGVRITHSNEEVIKEAGIVFLAFKPQNFPDAVAGLSTYVESNQIIISIMAGILIDDIQRHMPGKVVRVIPNTACLIGETAAGYAVGENVSEVDTALVETMMSAVGIAHRVSENDINAVTGLSGSGPAFVAYLIQAFIDGAAREGLTETVARDLALQTFSGTARLLKEWDMSSQDLIAMVSSPNGTTVAGREVLESSDVAEIIHKTIARAAERSRELAGS